MNFIFPTAAEMFEIAPDLSARDRADRLGLTLFPPKARATHHVRWWARDNSAGLMAMRGLDGQPPRIPSFGSTTYVFEPGVYGERDVITERELLTRGDPTNMSRPVDITEEVLNRLQTLITRKYDRMEYNVWTMLATGSTVVPVAGPNGEVVYRDTYPIQKFTATVPWGNTSTATPLADMQAMQQKSVGHGVDFGAGAMLVVNQIKANQLLNNTNPADYGGRKAPGGATLNSLDDFNNYFQRQNLPKVVVYDEGWQLAPLSGPITNPVVQYQKFLDNNTGILIGKRKNGDPLGEWQQTIQAMQPDVGNLSGAGPGEYAFASYSNRGVNAGVVVSPKVEIHHGFNGGLALYYGSGVVAASI